MECFIGDFTQSSINNVFPKDACNESNPRIIDDSRARKLANDLKRWKISNHLMVISS